MLFGVSTAVRESPIESGDTRAGVAPSASTRSTSAAFPAFALASFASRSDRPEPGYDDFGNAMGPDGYEGERGGHGQAGYDGGWDEERDGGNAGFREQ